MGDCPNCAELRAALELEISRRTVGGRPPPVDTTWANITTAPPSATDDSMPAHRRVGMARSDDKNSPPISEETEGP